MNNTTAHKKSFSRLVATAFFAIAMAFGVTAVSSVAAPTPAQACAHVNPGTTEQTCNDPQWPDQTAKCLAEAGITTVAGAPWAALAQYYACMLIG